MEAILIGIVFVLGLVAVGTSVAFREARLSREFPPISDDEFVARCSPGTSRHVALKVREIVARNLAVEYERVHPSMRFIEDIGAD